MKPSIGLSVHFVADDGVHLPAVVVAVNPDGSLQLCVFQSTVHHLLSQTHGVEQDQALVGVTAGTWHWPERE